jgi:N-methylhydantoinase A
MWRVGVDVGGTFTDLFAWEEGTGKFSTAKVLTTKKDRSIGVLEAIRKSGVGFNDISYLMHGTTTGTNALLERNYPDAAFITTQGFRDTLEIGRAVRKHLYDPYQVKPKPLVKRRHRFTISGRISAQGDVRRPLQEDEICEVAREISRRGIKSVGIGLINSYVNKEHEIRVREIINEVDPSIYAVISAETRPIFREHARFVTTAIRACLMPVMAAYFDRLDEALRDVGFSGSLLILKSNGGVMGTALAKERPEELIESGPAGGVAYASYLSRTAGVENIIHTDVGGTSFDASIVEKGAGLITRRYELEWEVPVSVPMLDIHSVGAGGGSIGWVDKGGSLRVGPQSAGSEPGPACYGRGGTHATITDANLVLGRLHPSLGDKFVLDVKASEKAIDALAQQIGLSRLETAEGMIRISCEKMAHAVKGVVTERARDPRDFVLTSFGGAGPMHASIVARAMGIPKVMIPAQAGVASAFGATAMNVRHDVEAFFYTKLSEIDVSALEAAFNSIEARGLDLLRSDGIDRQASTLRRSLQMRYVGQTFEIDVDMPAGELNQALVPQIIDAFHEAHQKEFGVCTKEFETAIVAISVSAIGKLPESPEFDFQLKTESVDPASRDVFFDGEWKKSLVYSSNSLDAGARISGPAIIEYPDTSAVLIPGAHAEMDAAGNLFISLN